jgi:hypothetical protein
MNYSNMGVSQESTATKQVYKSAAIWERVDIAIKVVTLPLLSLLKPKRFSLPVMVSWTPHQRPRHRTPGLPYAHWKKISLLAVAMLCLLTVACGSGNMGGSDPTNGHSSLAPSVAAGQASAGFLVVAGDDGVAVVKGRALRSAEGIPPQPYLEPGALAVPLGNGQAAATVTAGHVGVVSPETAAAVRDCTDCSGVAATSQYIVTTRKNFRPGQGFDFVFFNPTLSSSRVVAVQRLEERATESFPGENTESPVTLAAKQGQVTVGYLSRNGGARRGPSVVAQYTEEGHLIRSILVDGIIGRSTVSQDGRYFALGVGGSGGACVTVSDLTVIDLNALRVLDVGPSVPAAVVAKPGSLSQPWFDLSDLTWQGDTVTATGEVHNPPAGESCDRQPEIWSHTYDAVSGRSSETRGGTATATRWIGPGCDDVLEISGSWPAAALQMRVSGQQTYMGRYREFALSLGRPASCLAVPTGSPVSNEARP